MDDDVRELYQEVILDHGKNPRNFRQLEDANCEAQGNNPLCGDRLTVYLKVDEDRLICCLLYTSPSPRDATLSRMPSSA